MVLFYKSVFFCNKNGKKMQKNGNECKYYNMVFGSFLRFV